MGLAIPQDNRIWLHFWQLHIRDFKRPPSFSDTNSFGYRPKNLNKNYAYGPLTDLYMFLVASVHSQLHLCLLLLPPFYYARRLHLLLCITQLRWNAHGMPAGHLMRNTTVTHSQLLKFNLYNSLIGGLIYYHCMIIVTRMLLHTIGPGSRLRIIRGAVC